jgi:outer membrane protein assembly factor BamA
MKVLGIIFLSIIINIQVWGQQNKNWHPADFQFHLANKDLLSTDLQKQLIKSADSSFAMITAQQKGFREASLDSIIRKGASWHIYLHTGNYYQWGTLDIEGLSINYIRKAGLELPVQKQRPFEREVLSSGLEQCIRLFEDQGYPFSQLSQEAITYQTIGKDSLAVNLQYRFQPGPLVKIDSIHFKGNPKEEVAFLYALMRIRPGDLYNQSLIDDIPRILNNSIYYQQVKPVKVAFDAYGKSQLEISLKRKRAGKFDILLGLQPPTNPNSDQRLRVTGLADIMLVSALGWGEVLQLKYNQLSASRRILDASYTHPYILGTPFGLEGSFFFQVQDSSFLNRKLTARANYPIQAYLKAYVSYKSQRSDLLDARPYANQTTTPPVINGRYNAYGLGLAYEKLDYRLNPRKGASGNFFAGIGQRITPVDSRLLPEVFEQLPARQTATEIETDIHLYIPTFPKQTLHLSNHTYWLGQAQYFRNDQVQIGGGRSIRGFNENQFFTDLYSFFSVEYRLLLDRNSHIFAFGDAAYLRDMLNEDNPSQYPIGLGAGMRLDVKAAGILSIIYGVGRVGEQGFQPSRGKLHIGLTSQF